MVFTLVSAAQDHLSSVVDKIIQNKQNEKERIELERRKEEEKKVDIFSWLLVEYQQSVIALLTQFVPQEVEHTK